MPEQSKFENMDLFASLEAIMKQNTGFYPLCLTTELCPVLPNFRKRKTLQSSKKDYNAL